MCGPTCKQALAGPLIVFGIFDALALVTCVYLFRHRLAKHASRVFPCLAGRNSTAADADRDVEMGDMAPQLRLFSWERDQESQVNGQSAPSAAPGEPVIPETALKRSKD